MRAVIAIAFTLAIALFAQLGDAKTASVIAVMVAGCGAVLILATAREPEQMKTLTEPEPDFVVERRLLEALSEPAMLVVDGRVRTANETALNLLGAHILGEDVRLAIRHPAAAERLMSDAPDGVAELVGIGGRDQRHDMNVGTVAPGRRVIHLSDRTGRHAVEKARVDFVANASHELRTPLAALLGFIETLTDDNAGADPAVRARFLDVMLKEARRMQRLIDDLISLSRIEAEKFDLPDARVALRGLIEQVAAEIRDGAGEGRGEIELLFEDDIPDIVGERAQLSQVLHNLIGNAFKYGNLRDPVVITLAKDGPNVRLGVADRGDGIPPEHIPRLTERFYRVDSGRSRSLGGTGLGLAIVKHIVERHRGRMEIASRVGQGTTVSIVFPVPAATPPVTELSPD